MAAPAPNARFLDATQYSVSWFWKRLQADELDMQPPYQRNPVWQWQQKAFFIDSLIHGYPVPEIYLQTSVSNDGEEVHTIVDGQQRLRACMEFLADGFTLGDASPEFEGKVFSDLPEDVRGRIYRYKFVVRSLPDLSDVEIRDIFGRINRNNVALNRQELRHATYWGGFITTMEQFAEDPFWIKSGLFTGNDVRRMLDVEYISELVVAGLYGLQNKKHRLDHFYATYEADFSDAELATETMAKVLTELRTILDWPNQSRWSRKVDFYTLFVELWRRHETLPLQAEAVTLTRERLTEMSGGVSRVLALEDPVEIQSENQALVLYARGVRNSSDLGSRRMRARGLRAFVWEEQVDTPEEQVENPHLRRLPSIDDLLAPDGDEDQEEASQD